MAKGWQAGRGEGGTEPAGVILAVVVVVVAVTAWLLALLLE